MTPEQQRIAIAEACGWTEIEPCTCCDGVSRGYTPTPGAHKKHLPNYLFDLNAMHEAEETLQESQRVTYSNELYDLAVEHSLKTGKWSYLSMTATQRAEAFLRTIGKWDEAK